MFLHQRFLKGERFDLYQELEFVLADGQYGSAILCNRVDVFERGGGEEFNIDVLGGIYVLREAGGSNEQDAAQ